MFKRTGLGVVLSLCASVAFADPVSDRRAVMDQVRMGAATLVPMIKGDVAFDAKTADLALRMTYAAAIAFQHGGFFEDGTQSKGANPAIWDKFDDFTAKRAEFTVNAAAAVKAAPQDLAGLTAAYSPLLDNSAACHKDYRIKE